MGVWDLRTIPVLGDEVTVVRLDGRWESGRVIAVSIDMLGQEYYTVEFTGGDRSLLAGSSPDMILHTKEQVENNAKILEELAQEALDFEVGARRAFEVLGEVREAPHA